MLIDDEKELPDDDALETESDAPEGDEDALDGDEPGDADELPAGDEAEPEGGEAPDEIEEPARKPKTLSQLHREEKRARKEATDRATRAETERTEERRLREAAERRADQAERDRNERRARETADEEAARVALMSSEELSEHNRQKDRAEFDRRLQGMQFQQWDSTDRMEFRQLARDSKLIAGVKDAVEVEFEKLKGQGRTVSREIIANQLIAKRVRDSEGPAAEKQRQRAAASVRRETVRAPRSRSDVAPNRARRGEENSQAARAKRLADVTL